MATIETPTPVAYSPHVTRAIEKQNEQAIEIERDMEGVKSEVTRAALTNELAHLHDQVQELEYSQPIQAKTLAPAELRVRLLVFVANKERLDKPDDELRPVLLEILPKLYVKKGELVSEPETYQIR